MPEEGKRKSTSDGFVKVGQVIKEVLQTQRKHADVKMVRIWDVWPSAVGERIARHTDPAAFKGALLLVNVTDSAWLQQLWFLKTEIIEKVNESLGEKLVGEIRFKIGPVQFNK